MFRNLTRLKPPKISWKKIKNKILSADYDLSLVFSGDKEMSRLTKQHLNYKGPTNVLSFSLDKKSGEIFIDLPFAYREARKLGKTRQEHVLFLYVHSLLHLKGHKHDTREQSKIMQKSEKKWLKILS